jgi:hypothetical protein
MISLRSRAQKLRASYIEASQAESDLAISSMKIKNAPKYKTTITRTLGCSVPTLYKSVLSNIQKWEDHALVIEQGQSSSGADSAKAAGAAPDHRQVTQNNNGQVPGPFTNNKTNPIPKPLNYPMNKGVHASLSYDMIECVMTPSVVGIIPLHHLHVHGELRQQKTTSTYQL